ncbi:MAG: ABC transporter ATP-binding protein [Clostridia bacterium]|nr:ABC transporter ATP-binding protein [Clostridia bacterium]
MAKMSNSFKPPMGKGSMGKGPMKKGIKNLDFKALFRILGILFKEYKASYVIVLCSVMISAVASSVGGLFLNQVYTALENFLAGTPYEETWKIIITALATLGFIYLINIVFSYTFNVLGAILTQRFLRDMRIKLFSRMQKLPIKYFDTHTHGDIMSTYTNDIDALRQLVSQSMPQLLSTVITLVTLTFVMLYISVILFLVVVLGLIFITFVTKLVGGNSAKYFMAQQRAVAKAEGYIEESMAGQKVIKVFCHEDESLEKFDALNDELFNVSNKANAFSNILMPIIHNIGNILYVVIAFLGGGIVILTQGTGINISIQNLVLNGSLVGVMNIATVVSFLGLARRFANTTGMVSNQINSVVMAVAGSNRIFELLDEKPEEDNGYVTLVKAIKLEDGTYQESTDDTGIWVWKHPHKEDGSVTYTELKGDVRLTDVDFGYEENHIVLHGVTLYAEPGQKVAFVGATGAGKTTITNLINRFYDIADGKIRYDGININKIKKADLRRSLGIVLQDVSLFSGTIMDNIRYGKLDATDEECINAAKLANAHDFITRLPEGYNTYITGDGANFSQGQRQLLSIARAAVKNAPAMILDEATSSIDTRTELLVQKGTNRLMEGRTVFVIAHRLSTVKDADVIMVLDKGRIIERGSHDELIKQKGTYYRLYTGNFAE